MANTKTLTPGIEYDQAKGELHFYVDTFLEALNIPINHQTVNEAIEVMDRELKAKYPDALTSVVSEISLDQAQAEDPNFGINLNQNGEQTDEQ